MAKELKDGSIIINILVMKFPFKWPLNSIKAKVTYSSLIQALFHLLLLFCPLIFFLDTSELFEFNKMIFVYLMTALIGAFWLLRMISEKRFIFRKTYLDIFWLLFFLSQLLATIFSIDPHTSIFGYYSRFNGGLLSTASYLLLYWAYVANITSARSFIKTVVISAFLVSVWGIPSHFGYDPSCIYIHQRLDATCWTSDFNPTIRAFSTLGQPNWLAAFLGMVIPLNLALVLTSKNRQAQLTNSVLTILNYLAFTFSYSRGGTFGLIGSLSLFLLLLPTVNVQTANKQLFNFKNYFASALLSLKKQKILFLIIFIFFIINFVFGNALTQRPIEIDKRKSAVLENEGTESGQIRLVVWQGAWEVFKNYPVFGSGVETFAYSYYQFRPAAHNLVSEWEFLYNKAHNEYLNYLATTGALGLIAYLLTILVFYSYQHIQFFSRSLSGDQKIILIGLSAGYTAYLIQNVVGFSVVPIALLFFLYPAFSFISSEKKAAYYEYKQLPNVFNLLPKMVLKLLIVASLLVLLLSIYKYWYADTQYAKGLDYQSADPLKSYRYLRRALLYFDEPLYQSRLAYSALLLAQSYDQDKNYNEIKLEKAAQEAEKSRLKKENEELDSLSKELKKESLDNIIKALNQSPRNINLWRQAVNTYLQFAEDDPSYLEQAKITAAETVEMAPTEPQIRFSYAKILWQIDQKDEAVRELEKTIQLKPDFYDALKNLGQKYLELGQKDKAKEKFERVLLDYPEDEDSLEALSKL